MKKLVILISNAGTGSNLQAIIDAIGNHLLNATIVAVISDKKDAKGIERAKKYSIPTLICPAKEHLLPFLKELLPDYIVLAGWRQIITDEVLASFPDRILNLHPGLIPDTIAGKIKNPDGTDALWNRGMFTDIAIKNVLDKNATYAGSTVHFLSSEFDFGPILSRTFEKIHPNDTIESLYSRLKKKENKLYVEVLQRLCGVNHKS